MISFFDIVISLQPPPILHTVCTPSEITSTSIPQNEKTEIKHNLEVTRTMLGSMRLEPTTRQRLQLLLQRQHIEEEELRLRHFMELEKFRDRMYFDCLKNGKKAINLR